MGQENYLIDSRLDTDILSEFLRDSAKVIAKADENSEEYGSGKIAGKV